MGIFALHAGSDGGDVENGSLCRGFWCGHPIFLIACCPDGTPWLWRAPLHPATRCSVLAGSAHGLARRAASGRVLAGDVALELVDGLLLIGNDPLHQVAD